MYALKVLLAYFLVLAPCGLVRAEWPPEGIGAELGLPSVTDGGLEIRVWLGGGVLEPSELYRVLEVTGQVSVERIAWTYVPKRTEGLRTAKDATRESKEMRRFLTKERCLDVPTETQTYYWCREPVVRTGPWSVLLRDLLPDELWLLPVQLERKCGWGRFDGEIVAIEILAGQRHHTVSYDNPEFCCQHVACAIANHVRYVVRNEIK